MLDDGLAADSKFLLESSIGGQSVSMPQESKFTAAEGVNIHENVSADKALIAGGGSLYENNHQSQGIIEYENISPPRRAGEVITEVNEASNNGQSPAGYDQSKN